VTKKAGHLLFMQQVFNTALDIAKSIYFLASEVGSGGSNSFKLWLFSCIEGAGHHIYRLLQTGVIPAQPLATDVDIGIHFVQLFAIFFSRFHCFTLLIDLYYSETIAIFTMVMSMTSDS